MDVGINDLSFQFPFATERQAVDALENLAAMCLELESEKCTKVERIVSERIETTVELAPGKTLPQLLARVVSLDQKRYMMQLLVNRGKPYPKPENPFVFQERLSYLCAWAENRLVVSLASHEAFQRSFLPGRIEERDVQVANVSRQEHLKEHAILLGIRRYEANAVKHKTNRWNAYGKGRMASPMDLSDEEAQELLNRAIEVKGRLYARKHGKNYAFQNTMDNVYHGYIAEDLGDDILRELNKKVWE